MAAALVVPVSGPFTASLQLGASVPAGGAGIAEPIGTLNDDGYEMAVTVAGQEIAETDAYGMTLVESIYRGQNWRLRIRGLEWKNGLLAAMEAFGQSGAAATLTPYLIQIGQRWTNFSGILVMNAILGFPPTTPQSLTANSCAFAPNSQSAFQMTSKMRELPIEFVLYPYQATVGSSTLNIPFSTTG